MRETVLANLGALWWIYVLLETTFYLSSEIYYSEDEAKGKKQIFIFKFLKKGGDEPEELKKNDLASKII